MNLFWFRRDLRLDDNVGLFHALNSSEEVLPIFIFDETILSQLPKDDARVTFIHQQLAIIQKQLQAIGKSLADRKSTRLNSSHGGISRMPSSA